MKTVVILAGLVAIALAANVPPQRQTPEFKQGKWTFRTKFQQR